MTGRDSKVLGGEQEQRSCGGNKGGKKVEMIIQIRMAVPVAKTATISAIATMMIMGNSIDGKEQ